MQKILPHNAALIPDNATVAFKGTIFDVYQWPQTMFDGTTQTFEMLKRPDTVQVIVIRGDQLLLVQEEQPGRSARLHFPGGRVDPKDESWLAACQRELREETGLTCASWALVDVPQPIIKMEWFTPIFMAYDITEEAEPQLDAGGEKITPKWQSFELTRVSVLSGSEPTMQYLLPLFNRVESLGALQNIPEFTGDLIER